MFGTSASTAAATTRSSVVRTSLADVRAIEAQQIAVAAAFEVQAPAQQGEAAQAGDRCGERPADSHDLIRVRGARENNLKDVSVEIPKRRLTVFTGVSGSGKSSLVFGTIAAESQRLINETYSAFVQGSCRASRGPTSTSSRG
jgi:putative ribosome biogenesis GTPase RsgA